jgi:hypothetical protein
VIPLLEITKDRPDVAVHAFVLSDAGTEREIEEKNALAAFCGEATVPLTARRKAALLAESFLGLMRIRGAQCRSRHAEAVVCEKAALDLGTRGSA